MSKKIKPKRIDESHSFNINVACIVGDRKAILLKEIYGWCDKNLANNKNVFFDLPWTYNSAKAYNDKFKYWPEKSISRWLKELERDNWIYSTDKFNKFRIDRTKWYTIHFERYDSAVLGEELSISQNEEWSSCIELSISQNEISISQNDPPAYLKMRNDISQNDPPIPSLTTSYSSLTPYIEKKNKAEEKESRKEPVKAKTETKPIPPVAIPPLNFSAKLEMKEVVDLMYEHYTEGEGAGTLEMILDSVGVNLAQIDFKKICTKWVLKYFDETYTIINWASSSRKNLATWIENEFKSQTIQKRKEERYKVNGKKPERLKVNTHTLQRKEIQISKVPV